MGKNEVSQAKTTDPAVIDFTQYEGAGLESVTKDDILIPRLTLLQALSPQLNKRKSEFIEGAAVGDICDVGTGEIFEAPLKFLPVKFEKVYLEWTPRDNGGGLAGVHADDSVLGDCAQNDRGEWVNESGNIIQETSQFYGFNLSGDGRKCFVSFASTQLKKARKWNTLAMSDKVKRPDGSEYVPALFYRTYSLGSAEESNNHGDWSGWTIDRGEKLQDLENAQGWFSQAVEFYNQLSEGAVKADHSDLENAEGGGESAM